MQEVESKFASFCCALACNGQLNVRSYVLSTVQRFTYISDSPSLAILTDTFYLLITICMDITL